MALYFRYVIVFRGMIGFSMSTRHSTQRWSESSNVVFVEVMPWFRDEVRIRSIVWPSMCVGAWTWWIIEWLKQISETFHIVVGWHVPVDVEIADNRKTGGHQCVVFDETSKSNKKVSVRMFVLFRWRWRLMIASFMEFPDDETSTSINSKDFISSRRLTTTLKLDW